MAARSIRWTARLANGARLTLGGVADGQGAMVLADLLGATERPIAFVSADARRMARLRDALGFFAPGQAPVEFPAWDTHPYDRASPNAEIVARRVDALATIAGGGLSGASRILLTTANALAQRLPAAGFVEARTFAAKAGGVAPMGDLVRWLEVNGFDRVPTVRSAGEYAVRGGIVDLFPAGHAEPLRLDYFGDQVESIRAFDPQTQRSSGALSTLRLVPASEVSLDEESVVRFRTAYRAAFGTVGGDDPLYAAVSEKRRFPGLENWLPFFHERLETLFDAVPDGIFLFDDLAEATALSRIDEAREHFEARRTGMAEKTGAAPYKPVPPESLYLTPDEWRSALADRASATLSAFVEEGKDAVIDLGGRTGRTFAAERTAGDVNVFDAVIAHVVRLRQAGKRVVLAAATKGAAARLADVLADHGLGGVRPVATLAEVRDLPTGATGLAVLDLETGFETPDIAFVGDQDILGDRVGQGKRRRKRNADALLEATSLSEGDLVVHVDHGIARFAGLKTIEALGAPHDCLELTYAGGDRLFLPVENIELLTRYGGEGTEAELDRLGGAGWQTRKARLKKRIRDIADQLVKTAAARLLRTAPVLTPIDGVYGEFVSRFPFEPTDDQQAAIDAVLDDLSAGRPMDRLICGDVGFGKTEVALRAAFVAAMSGKQVAVVVPTTLLARQHFSTFESRFRNLPVVVEQASRLVGAKQLAKTRKALADGQTDIVIGTHALLAKGIAFRDLGLLVIDEEQHFGVKHKERLKELRTGIHVLTLTATPIPRTLQLALTGVRDLSLIATPPIDRLAVRTFIAPFDPLSVRETLMRERLRGGQSFFVVPRIADLAEMREFLSQAVPEAKVAVAHGQMAAGDLDEVMTAFYEGRHDVLLSTTIIESGLDIPTANTLVVHRADMFGLAQLYQLRGRVGRSKTRAYALLTTPPKKPLTPTAERRLKVLQSLDTLGAGFQLASHDLDIRGAGNLLGEEQSGHIREVGFELYQQMLEEAVASLRSGDLEEADDRWSPQIAIGMAVLIPEGYVSDLSLRMSLYRRLADLETPADIDGFAAELADRFGPLPDEVEHLLKVVYIKQLCRRANIEKVDAGPKGVVVAFRRATFDNPGGLVRYIGEQGSMAKIRPDQRLAFVRDWARPEDRLKGVAMILTRIVRIAEEGERKVA